MAKPPKRRRRRPRAPQRTRGIVAVRGAAPSSRPTAPRRRVRRPRRLTLARAIEYGVRFVEAVATIKRRGGQ